MVYRVPGKKKQKKEKKSKARPGSWRKEIILFEDDQGNKIPVECDAAEGVWWETDEYIFLSRIAPISERRKLTVIDLRPALVLKKQKREE